MTTRKLFILVLSVGLFAACSSKKAEGSSTSEAEGQTDNTAISSYMLLKDALVQTSVNDAQEAAKQLVKSATEEELNLEIIKTAERIASASDVEQQRIAFETVTMGMIEFVKNTGFEETIFVQYCPMAFDNTGASWLSMSDQIRNPYFGDMMLKCGRVTEEL